MSLKVGGAINKSKIFINKAVYNNVELKLNDINDEWVIIEKDSSSFLNMEVNAIYDYEAPIQAGRIFGTLRVFYKGEVIYQVQIFFANNVDRKNVWNYFFDCLEIYGF